MKFTNFNSRKSAARLFQSLMNEETISETEIVPQVTEQTIAPTKEKSKFRFEDLQDEEPRVDSNELYEFDRYMTFRLPELKPGGTIDTKCMNRIYSKTFS